MYFSKTDIRYEILVVDDGSADETAAVARQLESLTDSIRVLSYPENRGKGYAVRFGVLNSKGARVLFTDADGSTPIEEIERLNRALDSGVDVAIGSRSMFSVDTEISTVWYRKAMGRVFNGIVNMLLLPGIADTQCGFKLFTREFSEKIFSQQKEEGFSFDVEVLFLARKFGASIAEVPVNWTNVPGSKVGLIKDSCKMFLDVVGIRLRDFFGAYPSESADTAFIQEPGSRETHVS